MEECFVDSEGLWLKIAKKGSGERERQLRRGAGGGALLRLDRQPEAGLDEQHFLQRFTPRRPRGRWSRINRDKAEALIAAGKMRPAGLAEVKAAKADGRWEAAYEGQRTAEIPDDLQRELDANARRPRVLRPRSTAPTATRSSTASTTRKSRRRASGGCASSSRCSSAAKRSIVRSVAGLLWSGRLARPSLHTNGDSALAYEMQIRGTAGRGQGPQPLGGGAVAADHFGIYHLVWWYRINRELRDYGHRKDTTSGRTRPTRCWRCSPAGSSSSRR